MEGKGGGMQGDEKVGGGVRYGWNRLVKSIWGKEMERRRRG